MSLISDLLRQKLVHSYFLTFIDMSLWIIYMVLRWNVPSPISDKGVLWLFRWFVQCWSGTGSTYNPTRYTRPLWMIYVMCWGGTSTHNESYIMTVIVDDLCDVEMEYVWVIFSENWYKCCWWSTFCWDGTRAFLYYTVRAVLSCYGRFMIVWDGT